MDAPASRACANCGRALPEPRPNFCPECGQETRIEPPTLREFAQQFGGAYLSTEGALWRTLVLLLRRPGELTVQYLAGRRRHYVLPLRLYLTISVLTLLLVRAAGGPMTVNLVPDAQAPALRSGRINLQVLGNAGLKDGHFYCRRLPDWVCQRLKRRLDVDPQALALQAAGFKDRFTSNLGGGMFVLLPAFALWMKLAYFNRRRRYTEHLVFALHVHAFWFLALALTLPDRPWLTIPASIAVPWHTFLAMRRVYGGRRWPRLLRGALVAFLYSITLVAMLTGNALWSLLM